MNNQKNLEKENNTNSAPPISKINSSSIFVAAPSTYSSLLPVGGISLTRSSLSLSNPFEKKPERKFNALKSGGFDSWSFTSSETQNETINNELRISGSGTGWEASLEVKYMQTFNASQTRLVRCIRYAQTIGAWQYNLQEAKLRLSVRELLDPTGKSPEKLISDYTKFVQIYGFYCVRGFEMKVGIYGNWEIETNSVEERKEIEIGISAAGSKNDKKFQGTNQFLYSKSKSNKQIKVKDRFVSYGISKSASNPEQADEIVKNWDKYSNPASAAIGRVDIISWTSIPEISDLLVQIPSGKEYRKALEIITQGLVSQQTWNEINELLVKVNNLSKTVNNDFDKPFNNSFWGFFATKEQLPWDSMRQIRDALKKLKKQITDLSENDLEKNWAKLQTKLYKFWNRIEDAYKKVTKIPNVVIKGWSNISWWENKPFGDRKTRVPYTRVWNFNSYRKFIKMKPRTDNPLKTPRTTRTGQGMQIYDRYKLFQNGIFYTEGQFFCYPQIGQNIRGENEFAIGGQINSDSYSGHKGYSYFEVNPQQNGEWKSHNVWSTITYRTSHTLSLTCKLQKALYQLPVNYFKGY